jgi:hypothetical protein
MTRRAMYLAVVLCLALGPAAWAQSQYPGDEKPKEQYNHGNLGVYFDFTRPHEAGINLFGLGARLGINVRRHIVMEAEGAYDFRRSKTATVTAGGSTANVSTNMRAFHALFGPKIQTTGDFRVFGVLKAGLVSFGVGGTVTAGTISKTIGSITDGDKAMAIYPGGGIEYSRR